MPEQVLEILVGPIACGKTSYSSKRAAAGAIIVNDDSIVTAVHGGNYSLYRKGLKPLYKTIENTIVTHALLMGRDVIIDRPCMKRITRARYVALARSFDVPVRIITFPFQDPDVHAKRRVATDARGASYEKWLKAAEAQIAAYEQPDESEGAYEIITSQEARQRLAANELPPHL